MARKNPATRPDRYKRCYDCGFEMCGIHSHKARTHCEGCGGVALLAPEFKEQHDDLKRKAA